MRPQLATSDTFVEKLWVCLSMGVKVCADVQMRWWAHVCEYNDTCKSGQLHPRPSRSSLPTGYITLEDAFATFLKPVQNLLEFEQIVLCARPRVALRHCFHGAHAQVLGQRGCGSCRVHHVLFGCGKTAGLHLDLGSAGAGQMTVCNIEAEIEHLQAPTHYVSPVRDSGQERKVERGAASIADIPHKLHAPRRGAAGSSRG